MTGRRLRPLIGVLAAIAVSQTGTRVSAIAIPWLVLVTTGSATRTGLVALCDVLPRFAPIGKTADFAIVQAARVSYGEGTRKVNEDRGLIRYLARHRHTTPFEMVEFKFHQVMPIFVARQWIRHP